MGNKQGKSLLLQDANDSVDAEAAVIHSDHGDYSAIGGKENWVKRNDKLLYPLLHQKPRRKLLGTAILGTGLARIVSHYNNLLAKHSGQPNDDIKTSQVLLETALLTGRDLVVWFGAPAFLEFFGEFVYDWYQYWTAKPSSSTALITQNLRPELSSARLLDEKGTYQNPLINILIKLANSKNAGAKLSDAEEELLAKLPQLLEQEKNIEQRATVANELDKLKEAVKDMPRTLRGTLVAEQKISPDQEKILSDIASKLAKIQEHLSAREAIKTNSTASPSDSILVTEHKGSSDQQKLVAEVAELLPQVKEQLAILANNKSASLEEIESKIMPVLKEIQNALANLPAISEKIETIITKELHPDTTSRAAASIAVIDEKQDDIIQKTHANTVEILKILREKLVLIENACSKMVNAEMAGRKMKDEELRVSAERHIDTSSKLDQIANHVGSTNTRASTGSIASSGVFKNASQYISRLSMQLTETFSKLHKEIAEVRKAYTFQAEEDVKVEGRAAPYRRLSLPVGPSDNRVQLAAIDAMIAFEKFAPNNLLSTAIATARAGKTLTPDAAQQKIQKENREECCKKAFGILIALSKIVQEKEQVLNVQYVTLDQVKDFLTQQRGKHESIDSPTSLYTAFNEYLKQFGPSSNEPTSSAAALKG